MVVNDAVEEAWKNWVKLKDRFRKAVNEYDAETCIEIKPLLKQAEENYNQLYDMYNEPEPPEFSRIIYVLAIYDVHGTQALFSNIQSDIWEITFSYQGESITGTPKEVAKFANDKGLLAHMFRGSIWLELNSDNLLW